MESKKLISMLAMAAAMVGCSQEELVVDGLQNATVDLSGRPVLSEVVLGTGVNSRMALEGSIGAAYEEGDKIGACLIDKPNYEGTTASGQDFTEEDGLDYSSLSWSWADYVAGTKKKIGNTGTAYSFAEAGADARNFYQVTEWISTNYPFTCSEDKKFYTNAELVEGNYMFYLPYDQNYRIRENLAVTLPQVQDCSDEVMRETTKGGERVQVSSTALKQFFAGEMEGFEGAMAVVGYQFLGKDNTRPEVKLEPVFAYPLITVVNNFNGLVLDASRTLGASVDAAGNTTPVLGNTTVQTLAEKTIKIDSIQIYYGATTANPLFYKKSIKNEYIASEMASVNAWWNDRFAPESVAHTAEILNTEDAAYPAHLGNTSLPKAFTMTQLDKHVTLVLGKELAHGESYSFHAILPSADYGKNLKARVYATIDGKACVITNAVSAPAVKEVYNSNNTVTRSTLGYTYEGLVNDKEDYAFVNEKYGATATLELIRGEHYPRAEYEIDGSQATAVKPISGSMMTITLAKSTKASNNKITGATAFVLNETPTPSTPGTTTTYGIANNEEFINHLGYLYNGTLLEEDASLNNVAKTQWTAGKIAFKSNHTVVINEELIKAIHRMQKLDNTTTVGLKLTATQLGIGDDVVVSNVGRVYTFTTSDDYKLKVEYGNGITFNTDATKLVAGINEISSNATITTLAMKADNSNAIVYISGNANVKYAGATGINAIYMNGGTLTVDAACDVMIKATAGNIIMGANGSLTNADNQISASIDNTKKRTIAGTLENAVVSATFTQWPAELAQNTRINKVIVAPATTYALTLENTQIASLKNLTDVTVELGAYVSEIKSASNVTLSNIVAIQASAAKEWKNITSTNEGIIVNSATDVIFTNINAGTGVTFGNKIIYTHANTVDALQLAINQGKNVTLSSDITLTAPLNVAAGQNVIVNLNGKTITAPNNNDAIVVNDGKLTITGNGCVKATNGNQQMAVWADGANAEVVIENGTFIGSADNNGESNDVIYVKHGGKITINGGRFENSNPYNAPVGGVVINANNAENSGVITVNAGTFVAATAGGVYEEQDVTAGKIVWGGTMTVSADGKTVTVK